MYKNIIYTLFVILLTLTDGSSFVSADEEILYNSIMQNYNKRVRPRFNHEESVQVDIDMELIKIVGLDEINEVLTVVGIFVLRWQDEFLAWNPNAHNGITDFVIPPTDIWLPDIGIENSADTFYHDTFRKDFHVRVTWTGQVQWSIGGQISTLCGLDMTYFPFDVQKCKIQLENWAYHGDEVKLRVSNDHVLLDAYEPHAIWDMIRTNAVWKNVYFLATGPEPYPEVDFVFVIARKPLYYFLNLVFPFILLTVVALGVFWLPSESGEKVSLGVTLLLAFSVLQIVLADATPVSSDYNPVLVQLVIGIMVLSAISVLSSILILYFHHKAALHRAPLGVRKAFFRGLAIVVCMRSSVPKVTLDEQVGPAEISVEDMDTSEKSKMAANGEMDSIVKNLEFISQHMKQKEADDLVIEEWRAIGRVIDRILFWGAFLATLITTCVFLTKEDTKYDA